MPEPLSNDSVEVTVAPGTFTARWPATGVVLGPCLSAVLLGSDVPAPADAGRWSVTAGDGAGRPGRWARWLPDGGGTSIGIHVPSGGPTLVIEVERNASERSILDRVVVFTGESNLDVHRRLVDGYDSWAYSGVRDRAPGASFWNTALVDTDGRALVMQALTAERYCTRITNDGARLRVECGATPPLDKVPETWGYVAGIPPPTGLPIDAGQVVRSEPLAVASTGDALALVEELAALAGQAMHARDWTGPAPNGWESWYQYGLDVAADDVLANARTLRARYAHAPGFDLVQLDDGWQRTYGAWWPNERFPEDLTELVHELRALGCRPGLWVAPFRVQPDGPGVASEHPDWCLRDGTGAPLREDRHGTWALDATSPAALAWLRDLGARIGSWGFEMVKVDFCYLAALEGGRHDRARSGIEALRGGMRALTEGLGDRVYVLGCGMPVLPAVGLCHGNRVGHDLAMPRAHQELGHPLDQGWTGYAGIRAQARNVTARWAHAGRWYAVDPEVVMAWGSDGRDPAGYTIDEAQTLATMAMICGGPFLLADDLTGLTEAERAVLEHPALLELTGSAPWRPVDLFEHCDPDDVPEHAYAQGPGIPHRWATRHRDARLVALFNWDDEPARLEAPSDAIPSEEVWTGATITAPQVEVPPHGVRLLRH